MCEGLTIQLSDNWPDYVFEENYHLMPITELEKNIIEHKHLPGIPAAAEVEEVGIKVEDITTKLTEKVEELTLYIIELHKRIEKLEKETK